MASEIFLQTLRMRHRRHLRWLLLGFIFVIAGCVRQVLQVLLLSTDRTREAKISNLHCAILIHEAIGWL